MFRNIYFTNFYNSFFCRKSLSDVFLADSKTYIVEQFLSSFFLQPYIISNKVNNIMKKK